MSPCKSHESARFAPRRRRLDFLQRIAKIGGVLEAAVDGGEADVRDLVEFVELTHHHFADLPRWDFALAQAQDLLHDALDRLVDVFRRHRALVQRALEAIADPLDVEVGARAILLDDLRQAELRVLVGREALLTGGAAPAATNRVAGFRHA